MNKRISLLVLLCLSVIFSFAQTPDHVVISQVFGGGGNSGAPFKNDFVELYNPTNQSISLTGWSLQYAGEDASNWNSNKIDLSGTINPGHYFLIALNGGNNGVNLPAPDYSSNAISMAASGGKVALVNNTTVLSGKCPTGAGIVDFVGYGGAKCFEGNSSTVTPGNSEAIHRKGDGCTDSDDNEKDFFKRGPSPRNSTALSHGCGSALIISGITTQVFCVNANQAAAAVVSYTSGIALSGSVRAYLTDAIGSYTNGIEVGAATASGNAGTINITVPAGAVSGTDYFIRLHAADAPAYSDQKNVEIIYGAKSVNFQQAFPDETEIMVRWQVPSGCFDEFMVVARQGIAPAGNAPTGDGSTFTADPNFNGNGTSFNEGKIVYKGAANEALATGLTLGQTYFFTIYTRKGNNWSTGVTASTMTRAIPKRGDVLINAFSTRYASADHEFIELVNTTGKSFDLADLQLAYQSSTGAARVPTGLSGTLAPHSFWLLASELEVSVGATNALARDASRGTAFADHGHLAITRKKDNSIIDAVAYGNVSGGTFIEGTPAAGLSAAGGLRRKMDGLDTDNNSIDFEVIPPSAIDLRNSQSRLARDGAVISAATNLKRIYVTGNVQIASNMVLTEKLVLQAGRLALNNFNLTTQNIEGGNANAYVQTNGTGPLAIPVTGATPILFPVGRSTYNPVTLQHPGSLSWSVNVLDAVQAANPDGAVQRTWNITPSAVPTTGATVSFQYDEGDATQLGSAFDVADQVQVYHQHDGVWKKAGDPLNPAGAAGGIRTVTLSNWTQFSAFVLNGAAQGPLPVKFAALRLFGQGTDLVLQFTVHNELGVDHYKVETSADGHNWEVRALLKPQSNSGATVQYEFRDARPLVADRYYRVQAIEATGAPSFSGVAKARAKWTNAGLQVAPNPVVGTNMHYTCGGLPAGNYTVRIVNGAGQPVLVTRMVHAGGWLSANLALPHLQGGWYVLELAGPQVVRQTFLVR